MGCSLARQFSRETRSPAAGRHGSAALHALPGGPGVVLGASRALRLPPGRRVPPEVAGKPGTRERSLTQSAPQKSGAGEGHPPGCFVSRPGANRCGAEPLGLGVGMGGRLGVCLASLAPILRPDLFRDLSTLSEDVS